MAMSWYWQPSGGPPDAEGQSALGLDRLFDSQGDAESWLGEFYPDLVDADVESVTLYENDRLVYGPMMLDVDAEPPD